MYNHSRRRLGEYPHQQELPCLSRRLRPLDHHWCRVAYCIQSLLSLPRFESVSHVVHRWRDHSVDESRITRSGSVWDHRLPTDEAIRLLCSRDGCVRGTCVNSHSHRCLTYMPSGSLRKYSLLGDHERASSDKHCHEQRETTETRGVGEPRIYR